MLLQGYPVTEIIPSYMRKVIRAEKHLVDLKVAVSEWAAREPYTVRETVYRRRKAHHLTFTDDPLNTEIGIITADLVYNLRSGLDHLAAALVPAQQRDSVSFPIFWKGVWEAPVPGENKERAKDRARWNIITSTMQDGAVALLKQMQPTGSRQDGGKASSLLLLNRLSNTDRHQQFPVFPTALTGPLITWVDSYGSHAGADSCTARDRNLAVEDGAELQGIPKDAMNVKIQGTPLVAVRIANHDGYGHLTFEVPATLDRSLVVVRDFVVAPLIPHLHVRGG